MTCVNRLVRYEFPNGFQIVNEQALHLLRSSDANAVSAGLLVTQEILKYRSSSSDKNLETHLATFMPQLLLIGQQAIGPLSSVASSTPEVHAILKLSLNVSLLLFVTSSLSIYLPILKTLLPGVLY